MFGFPKVRNHEGEIQSADAIRHKRKLNNMAVVLKTDSSYPLSKSQTLNIFSSMSMNHVEISHNVSRMFFEYHLLKVTRMSRSEK